MSEEHAGRQFPPGPHRQAAEWLAAGVPIPEVETRLRDRGLSAPAAARVVDEALGARLRAIGAEQARKSKRGWWAALGGLAVLVLVVGRLVLVGLRLNEPAANAPSFPSPAVPNFYAGLPPLEESIRRLNDPLPAARKGAALTIQREARQPTNLRAVPPEALPGLLLAAQDQDNDVRLAAGLCLARLGPTAVPALLDGLRQQRQGLLWPCALFGLPPLGKAAVAAVPNPLLARRQEVCMSFGLALGRMGQPAMPRILEALRDANSSVRLGAVWALLVLGPEAADARPALLERLRDRDHEVQLSAGLALARMGKPAVPDLAARLEDRDEQVRLCAANALAHVGPTLDANRAEALSVNERLALQRSMQRQRAEARREALPALVKALKDPSAQVRLRAAEALLVFPEQRPLVRATLEGLRKGPNAEVSRRAGRLLRPVDPLGADKAPADD
jgi:HEAT repeat protein